jgi:hypothetical protein
MVPGPNVKIFIAAIYCHSKLTPILFVIKQCYHGNYHGVDVSNTMHGYLAWYSTLEKVRAKLNYCGILITLSLGPQKYRFILTVKK